jgi:phytanoyl-CoA hydroxylase
VLGLTHILTKDQLAFYKDNRFLLVKGVIPDDVLRLARKILERWIDDLIVSWYNQGLLNSTCSEVDFERRLVVAWNLANKPKYARSPRRDLVSPYMYEFLKHQVLLDLAADLLETDEVSVHGIFNARPKLPDQKWTDTPWHQDAQYYRDAEHRHVISMWMPLQRVTEHNSCLQMAPGFYKDHLLEGTLDEESGFIGLSKEAAQTLKGVSIEMDPGDIVVFNHMMPHRALSNHSDAVRWSMDIRFEATEVATESGQKQGFVGRSLKNPSSVTNYHDWLRKWNDIPLGSY